MQLTSLTEPPCTQCSWSENANAFSVPTLWTVQRTASHVGKLVFADWHLTYAFENLSLRFVYGHGKACDQRWAVVRSTVRCHAINGKLSTMRVATPRNLPLPWLCDVRRCPRSDIISELRQRVAVDTLMTSHYSGDVTWIWTKSVLLGELMRSD
jgi:hypothetical protein